MPEEETLSISFDYIFHKLSRETFIPLLRLTYTRAGISPSSHSLTVTVPINVRW